jgi:hypothetical protein
MGTINKQIADEIIAGGYKSDKPVKIVTYNNMFEGGLTYAVVCASDPYTKYEQSPACSNVRTVWTKAGGVVK